MGLFTSTIKPQLFHYHIIGKAVFLEKFAYLTHKLGVYGYYDALLSQPERVDAQSDWNYFRVTPEHLDGREKTPE